MKTFGEDIQVMKGGGEDGEDVRKDIVYEGVWRPYNITSTSQILAEGQAM